jgi:23S rRNA pseudouridine1911/1915/1917 synthase
MRPVFWFVNSSQRFELAEAMRSLRLDQALARLIPDRSRNFLARLIEQGQVWVDGRTVTKSSHRLGGAAEIRVEIPEPRAVSMESQPLDLAILYQDREIAVINKPPGMVVHPSAGHGDWTMVNALLFHLDSLSGIGGELRPGIVHRLDKDTSGVMIVAKNDRAHRTLSEAWRTDAVRKEYLALVYGTPKESRGSIEKAIGRDPRDRKRMAVLRGGRAARTDYQVVERFRYLALLQCLLRTGRTHQIRVHLKSIGHPIVGDPVYSGPQWRGIPDKKLQKLLSSFPRQALHAVRITFPHPGSDEPMTFEAPLPADFAGLLEQLSS